MIELIILVIIIIIVLFSRVSGNDSSLRDISDNIQIIPIVPKLKSTDNNIQIAPRTTIEPRESKLANDDIQIAPRTTTETHTDKNVKFAPRVTVRTFNINNGEILNQYTRNL